MVQMEGSLGRNIGSEFGAPLEEGWIAYIVCTFLFPSDAAVDFIPVERYGLVIMMEDT
jgi:hypothetical protein